MKQSVMNKTSKSQQATHEHRIKCAENLVFFWGCLRSEILDYANEGYQIERMRHGSVIRKVLRNPTEPEKYFIRSDRSEYSRDWREFVSAAFGLFGCNLAAAVRALESVPPFSGSTSSEERDRIRVAHILECATRLQEPCFPKTKETTP